VAALHAIFFTFLKSGDHVVVSDVTYEAVARLFGELLPQRYGIDATFVDVSDLGAVKAAMRVQHQAHPRRDHRQPHHQGG
jgi:methionine-gamma-lyase